MEWGVLSTLASTLLPNPQVMPLEEKRRMPREKYRAAAVDREEQAHSRITL